MHMKKAVIFDLDGTLANTLTSLAYCTNRALEDFGLQAIPQECYKKFVGNGARMQITRALRYVGAKEQPSPVRDDDGFAAVPCLLDFWTMFMTDTWNISQRTACMRSSPILAFQSF